MMERGNPPEAKEELILSNPKKWSPEASNFLSVTGWEILKGIKNVRQAYLFVLRMALIDFTAQVSATGATSPICRRLQPSYTS
jgi:hypothetical protein